MSICYFVDQRLLSFYALLFTWVDVFATEFPDVFDREEIVDWIQNVYVSELKADPVSAVKSEQDNNPCQVVRRSKVLTN